MKKTLRVRIDLLPFGFSVTGQAVHIRSASDRRKMKFSRLAAAVILAGCVAAISGCGGKGSSSGYYGYRYGADPWYYRGGYVRDRVLVVSEEDIRTLEILDSLDLPPSPDPGFDMGFSDMDFGGGDFDF